MAGIAIIPVSNSLKHGVVNALDSSNLFIKANATSGYYVNSTNGNLVASASFYVSEFIAVSPSANYIKSYVHDMAFYDSNQVYISGSTGTTGIITTPSNCAYVRLSVSNSLFDIYTFTRKAYATLPNVPCREVTVIAKKANVGSVFVGGANVNLGSYGVELSADGSYTFAVSNANLISIVAANSGEGVSYVAL